MIAVGHEWIGVYRRRNTASRKVGILEFNGYELIAQFTIDEPTISPTTLRILPQTATIHQFLGAQQAQLRISADQ